MRGASARPGNAGLVRLRKQGTLETESQGMHWVDRGPDPEGLERIQARYTPRWLRYYGSGDGEKPSDSRWREFSGDLADAFNGLCAYCEEICRGEVDHFRPKSRYPDLVYSWSNWLFACHDCNHAKLDKWPPRGYVDPCARSRGARPEHFFSFDILTGEILPKEGLSRARHRKAQGTIDDLRLNEWHHLRKRLLWLQLISAIIPGDPAEMTAESEEERAHLASRTTPHSSITRRWLSERGHRPD